MLLAALPLVFFGTAWATLALRRQARGQAPDWRGAFLAASIAWGIVVALGTELLSIGQSLTRGWLVALWSTGILAGLLCMAWQWRQARGRPAPPARQPVRLPRLGLALLSGIALIAAAVALIALVSPPNNWDSMTYHLGRVVHWIQNRSVVFFPTHILRQNQQPPWSEYAVMHFMLLGGGDRLANLVQWFAMAGSVLGVSLIARELGADWRGQLLAAVFAVSLPMGVLQGASTQNDYVLAFWLVCFVFFLLPFVRRGPVSQALLLAMSASLALALLTKATAYVYAFPFAAVFGWVQLRAVGGRAWLSAAVVMVVVLLVNGGHYWRNISLFGLPLGPTAEGIERYTNEVRTVPVFASNVIRNAAIQFGTPSARVNRWGVRAVELAHRVLRLDASDPRTTWGGHTFKLRKEITHEDIAGNPLHLLLILVMPLGLWLFKDRPRRDLLALYAGLLLLAFGLFCLYIKWQPWNVRLHLPLFVLWAPFVGILLAALPWPRLAATVAVGLLVCALPWLLFNKSRPLAGESSILRTTRADEYFRNNPAAQREYTEAAAFLKSQACVDIGLVMRHDDWEYPLWVLLDNLDASRYRLEHYAVSNNPSGILASEPPFDRFQPCAILTIQPATAAAETVFHDVYARVWSSTTVNVYARP